MIALFVRDIMFLRMKRLRTNLIIMLNYGTGSDTETELYPMMKYHAAVKYKLFMKRIKIARMDRDKLP